MKQIQNICTTVEKLAPLESLSRYTFVNRKGGKAGKLERAENISV